MFAEENQNLSWYGAGDAVEPGEWAIDFRVGGRDVDEGTFDDGPASRYEATYTDVVEHGVFFDQFWADGLGREEGTLGLREALCSFLA